LAVGALKAAGVASVQAIEVADAAGFGYYARRNLKVSRRQCPAGLTFVPSRF
jgi:hypothetical protein